MSMTKLIQLDPPEPETMLQALTDLTQTIDRDPKYAAELAECFMRYISACKKQTANDAKIPIMPR